MAAPGPPRLEVVRGSLPRGASAALLAGSFNPITRAHTALAIAGHRSGRDRVVLAMAPVSRVGDRGPVHLHQQVLAADAGVRGGAAGDDLDNLEAGRAVQRLGDPRYYEDLDVAIQRLGRAASLLVAERAGHPAAALPLRSAPLATPGWTPGRSSTQARAAASGGEPLDELVPSAIARSIRRTGAYDPDPGPYLARARELDRLLSAQWRTED